MTLIISSTSSRYDVSGFFVNHFGGRLSAATPISRFPSISTVTNKSTWTISFISAMPKRNGIRASINAPRSRASRSRILMAQRGAALKGSDNSGETVDSRSVPAQHEVETVCRDRVELESSGQRRQRVAEELQARNWSGHREVGPPEDAVVRAAVSRAAQEMPQDYFRIVHGRPEAHVDVDVVVFADQAHRLFDPRHSEMRTDQDELAKVTRYVVQLGGILVFHGCVNERRP